MQGEQLLTGPIVLTFRTNKHIYLLELNTSMRWATLLPFSSISSPNGGPAQGGVMTMDAMNGHILFYQ